jgi:HK97 family phage major capsid protein/HK97 family phage prohead protease
MPKEFNRAYSVLTIKSIDPTKRTIVGLATSPEPDRVGDIVEPKGVKFKNPLPLLLHHDKTMPVGLARFDRPTDDGITFTAQFPEIPTPGALRDRVDEALQSVQAGLIRGVSIGFRALGDIDESIEFLRSGGVRFKSIEVMELSLVTIPAHQLAAIHTIKALDTQDRAAIGERPATPSRPGAAGTPRTSTTMTLSERLTKTQTDLRTKVDALTALVGAEEGAGLDATQRGQRDTLTTEVDELQATVRSLAALEAAQAASALPVTTKAHQFQAPQSTQIPHVEVKRIETPPGIGFARVLRCKMASILNQGMPPQQFAREYYGSDPRIEQYFKAAVAAGTTTDSTWAGPLVTTTNLASEFLEFLRPRTIIGQFGQNGIPSLKRVPFNVRITGQTSGGSASWVGQGKLKPLTKFDYSATTLLWAKIASVAVFSDELARFSSPSAETLIRDGLAKAIIAKIDTDLVDPTKVAVANVSPASLTSGILGNAPSGTTEAAVRADMNKLLGAFLDGNQDITQAVIIMPNTVALSLSLMVNSLGQPSFPNMTMQGGRLLGIPVITSQYAATTTTAGSPWGGNLVIVVNADDVFLADDGQVDVAASRDASIEMSGDPEVDTGTVVSMFQSNQIALRAERYINWARARTTAVDFIYHVEWGGAGSPAAA